MPYAPQNNEYNDYTVLLKFDSGGYQATVYASLVGTHEVYGANVLRAILGVEGPDEDAIRALLTGEIPDVVQGLSEEDAVEEITGQDPEDLFENLLLELAADARNAKVLKVITKTDEDTGEMIDYPVLTLKQNRRTIDIEENIEDYLITCRITQSRPTHEDVIEEINSGFDDDEEGDDDSVDSELD